MEKGFDDLTRSDAIVPQAPGHVANGSQPIEGPSSQPKGGSGRATQSSEEPCAGGMEKDFDVLSRSDAIVHTLAAAFR